MASPLNITQLKKLKKADLAILQDVLSALPSDEGIEGIEDIDIVSESRDFIALVADFMDELKKKNKYIDSESFEIREKVKESTRAKETIAALKKIKELEKEPLLKKSRISNGELIDFMDARGIVVSKSKVEIVIKIKDKSYSFPREVKTKPMSQKETYIALLRKVKMFEGEPY